MSISNPRRRRLGHYQHGGRAGHGSGARADLLKRYFFSDHSSPPVAQSPRLMS
jgi:hypothetical protein